jgi:sugar/nucleoside kinase (ribokinase family)
VNGPTADYLVIGHVCLDHTPLGLEFGGTALFGAVTALRLGARVHVLTSMPESEVRTVFPNEVAVHNIPSPVWCTFRHEHYGTVREQWITDVAHTLRPEHVPPSWRDMPLVHFGPVAQEVDHELLGAFEGALRGGSVQGWLRRWGADGHVQPLDPEEMLAWAPPVEFSFLSEEDIGDQRGIIDLYRRRHRVVVLTDGSHGATVFEGDTATFIPAFPTTEVDPNGAGDVFSTAFMIRFHETQDAIAAARFAAVVASFHVEKKGTDGVPNREQVESRLREYDRL